MIITMKKMQMKTMVMVMMSMMTMLLVNRRWWGLLPHGMAGRGGELRVP